MKIPLILLAAPARFFTSTFDVGRSMFNILLLTALPALAQGPLAPPSAADPKTGPLPPLSGGLPQPTMKTLHQVEPRLPLTDSTPGVTLNSNGGFTVANPGSYYLTASITVTSGDGINISASGGITLDLNGFTISSTSNPAGGTAIRATNSLSSLTLMNGNIMSTGATDTSGNFTGAGFDMGINAFNLFQVRISGIHIKGAKSYGIYCDSFPGSSTALVENCAIRHCGGTAINAVTISSCHVIHTSGAPGIFAQNVSSSSVVSYLGSSISANRVVDSYGETLDTSASGVGISASMVINSTGKAPNGSLARPIGATTAVACISSGPANLITNRYNMPASP